MWRIWGKNCLKLYNHAARLEKCSVMRKWETKDGNLWESFGVYLTSDIKTASCFWQVSKVGKKRSEVCLR